MINRLISLACVLLFTLQVKAIDPMTVVLQGYDPLPVVTLSWPFNDRVVNDPGLLREMTRVLRCGSASLRWADHVRLRKIRDANPPLVALHWSPYHDAWGGNPKWEKGEVCGPIKIKDLDYFKFFYEKAVTARMLFAQTPIIMIFDHEIGCGRQNEGLGDKLNVLYRVAKEVFRGEVIWYKHDMDYGVQPVRSISPVADNTHGDLRNFSCYYQIDSVRNRQALEATAEVNDGDIGVWLSIGGVYESWPWTPLRLGVKKHSPNVTWSEQLGNTWTKGWWFNDEYPRRTPRLYGPVGRVKYVILWPEPLRAPKGSYPGMSDTAFTEFLNGAHEIRRSQP